MRDVTERLLLRQLLQQILVIFQAWMLYINIVLLLDMQLKSRPLSGIWSVREWECLNIVYCICNKKTYDVLQITKW